MMFLDMYRSVMCEHVENPGQSIIFISYDYSYFILFYFILLPSPLTEQWIINKCLIGTVATTAASQLQWSQLNLS